MEALKKNHENILKLGLDNTKCKKYSNPRKIMHFMISLQEIAAQKVVEGLVATLPTYLNT